MLEEYKQYLVNLRNNLIQCGVEYPITSISSYRDILLESLKLEQVLWFYSVMGISGSDTAISEYFIPLTGYYKEKMRQIFYREFQDFVKDYRKISKKAFLAGMSGTDVYPVKFMRTSKEESLVNSNPVETTENITTHGVFLEDISKESSEEDCNYVSHGVYLDTEESESSSSAETVETCEHGVYLDDLIEREGVGQELDTEWYDDSFVDDDEDYSEESEDSEYSEDGDGLIEYEDGSEYNEDSEVDDDGLIDYNEDSEVDDDGLIDDPEDTFDMGYDNEDFDYTDDDGLIEEYEEGTDEDSDDDGLIEDFEEEDTDSDGLIEDNDGLIEEDEEDSDGLIEEDDDGLIEDYEEDNDGLIDDPDDGFFDDTEDDGLIDDPDDDGFFDETDDDGFIEESNDGLVDEFEDTSEDNSYASNSTSSTSNIQQSVNKQVKPKDDLSDYLQRGVNKFLTQGKRFIINETRKLKE